MALYRLNELLIFLEGLGVEPKKGLSQNFLIDGNIVRKIIELADVHHGETVLEIGAGPGVLTEALLNAGAHVIAVEKDAVFAKALTRFSSLEVFEGDILNFVFPSFQSKIKVVSNLPYNITKQALTLLAPRNDLFETITVMVQEEVAQKIVRKRPSNVLSVILNFYADVHYGFKVSKKCFYPQPKVDSAVLSLHLKKPFLANEADFLNFIKTSFEKKRKLLCNNLDQRNGAQKVRETLLSLGFDPNSRAEEFSLENFLLLYNELQKH